jgi:hypothetical protein
MFAQGEVARRRDRLKKKCFSCGELLSEHEGDCGLYVVRYFPYKDKGRLLRIERASTLKCFLAHYQALVEDFYTEQSARHWSKRAVDWSLMKANQVRKINGKVIEC